MYGRIALLNENTAYSCGRFKKTNMCKEGVTIFHGILKKIAFGIFLGNVLLRYIFWFFGKCLVMIYEYTLILFHLFLCMSYTYVWSTTTTYHLTSVFFYVRWLNGRVIPFSHILLTFRTPFSWLKAIVSSCDFRMKYLVRNFFLNKR